MVRAALIALALGLFWVALSLALSTPSASAAEVRPSGLLGDISDSVEDTVLGVTDEVVNPVVAPITQPVIEKLVQPAVSHVAEPVVSEVARPVVKPVVTEVVQPVITPVVDEVVEPVVDVVDATVRETGGAVVGITEGASDLLDGVLPLDPITDPVAALPGEVGDLVGGVLDDTSDIVGAVPGVIGNLPGAVIDVPGDMVDELGSLEIPGVVGAGVGAASQLPAVGAGPVAPAPTSPAVAEHRAAASAAHKNSIETVDVPDRAVESPRGNASGDAGHGGKGDASATGSGAAGAHLGLAGFAVAPRFPSRTSATVSDDELPSVPTFSSDSTPD
jgi:hypothetical protein